MNLRNLKHSDKFPRAVLAGILITIGCTAYLSVDSKYMGALLFTVGLIGICYLKLNLFTGKVGYLIQREVDTLDLLIILLGNFLGAYTAGLLVSFCYPNLLEKATLLLLIKNKISLLNLFIRGIFCGILMYIAVEGYKGGGGEIDSGSKGSPLAILLAIPAFILSSFEHSIAYIGYAGIAQQLDLNILVTIIMGNSIGSLLASYLHFSGSEKPLNF